MIEKFEKSYNPEKIKPEEKPEESEGESSINKNKTEYLKERLAKEKELLEELEVRKTAIENLIEGEKPENEQRIDYLKFRLDELKDKIKTKREEIELREKGLKTLNKL